MTRKYECQDCNCLDPKTAKGPGKFICACCFRKFDYTQKHIPTICNVCAALNKRCARCLKNMKKEGNKGK